MKDNMFNMIEPVARQMCIVAGADPDSMVYVLCSWTLTKAEKLSSSRTYFPGALVFASPSPSMYNNRVEMNIMSIPAFRSDADDPEIYAALWLIYRDAAYDAIIAHYAVKQVIMVGKEIPK